MKICNNLSLHMQTENANCESYCWRTLSSSWLSKINLKRNLINYLRTLCKVRMQITNIIAEELWLSEINFKWFTINLTLHVQTENVNCTFYCWRTLITQNKFQEIYDNLSSHVQTENANCAFYCWRTVSLTRHMIETQCTWCCS